MNRQHIWLIVIWIIVLGLYIITANADTRTHYSSRIDGLLLPGGR